MEAAGGCRSAGTSWTVLGVNAPMKHKRDGVEMFWMIAGLAGVLAVGAGLTMAAGKASDRKAPRKQRAAQLKVGQLAPDFELPVLKEEKNEKGEKVARITSKKVKLSSFRGKKLVCVFFSSYT